MTGVRLSELCLVLESKGFSARVDGEDRPIRACNTLEDARVGDLSFLSNPKYVAALGQTQASAVVVREDVNLPDGLPAIRCDDPYACITVAIIVIHGHRKHPAWKTHTDARIDPTAKLGKNPNIAGGVTIAANVVVGDNCVFYPGCYLADGVRIGSDCTLYPNVVVYDHCVLGERVTVHAGSVIGQDGLGYAPHNDKWIKIPQIGRTIIGDDVEIGSNCSIDRATLGTTEIGSGTKFGNSIVIGHGTKVGPDCLFVGQVGVAGSATIGQHVTLAGQVGVAGHLTIGDQVRVGAQAGVLGNVPSGQDMLGSPAFPIEDARRSIYAVRKLPEWIKRIKDLEREVKALRDQADGVTP